MAETNIRYTEVVEQDGIATIKLVHGVTNPINLGLVQELAGELERLRTDESVTALVLTSTNEKFFSIGFNLPELIKLDLDGVITFLRAFNALSLTIYTFPKPIIAALTGHAIAGGCILALGADYRIIADGKKLMGLNEIKLGLPVPYPADRILTQLVGSQTAMEIMATGEFYPAQEALLMGLVDQVVPGENVMAEAVDKARVLGAMPSRAFEIIKGNRVGPIEKQIKDKLAVKEQLLYNCWTNKHTQELLKEASKKF